MTATQRQKTPKFGDNFQKAQGVLAKQQRRVLRNAQFARCVEIIAHVAPPIGAWARAIPIARRFLENSANAVSSDYLANHHNSEKLLEKQHSIRGSPSISDLDWF